MDVSSDIRFLAGKPWRRRHHGHPPGFDYSECDDYLCPIYIYVDGRQLAFLADSDGSRPGFRDDLARHSDLMSLAVPR